MAILNMFRCVWIGVFAFFYWVFPIGAQVGFYDVRFARCDVDGDGVWEVVAGGRMGPALPVDAPRHLHQGGVGIFRASGNMLHMLSTRQDLHAILDVAAGDIDGDGRDEIATVGLGQLTIFAFQQDQLKTRLVVDLEGLWTDRVVIDDVDGDGRDDVGVTVYEMEDQAEIGQTTVVFYRWQGSRLLPFRRLLVDQHVGDLCVVSNHLVMEVGSGDEGGQARMYGLTDGIEHTRTLLTQNGVRVLSLDTQDTRLIAGSIDGLLGMFDVVPTGLVFVGRQTVERGIKSLVWLPNGLGGSFWIGNNHQGVVLHPLGF